MHHHEHLREGFEIEKGADVYAAIKASKIMIAVEEQEMAREHQ